MIAKIARENVDKYNWLEKELSRIYENILELSKEWREEMFTDINNLKCLTDLQDNWYKVDPINRMVWSQLPNYRISW